jgi:DNA-binding PadR family transcriptional regulator
MRFSHHHSHGDRHGHGQHGHPFGHRGRGHGFGRHRWGDDEEGRGGRRRRVFDSNELRLVLLKLIADQPRHGYELIRAIEDLTGGAYVPSPGVVYPTLTMLQDMGQITEAQSDGARKAFSVTPDGSEHLASRKEEVEALFARLAALADARERSDGGPVRRAMKNLKMVLIDKLERESVKSETLHEMAALIDEAARKIERL